MRHMLRILSILPPPPKFDDGAGSASSDESRYIYSEACPGKPSADPGSHALTAKVPVDAGPVQVRDEVVPKSRRNPDHLASVGRVNESQSVLSRLVLDSFCGKLLLRRLRERLQ
mmetsp:Transcript_21434/g.57250  ORF Transcript_21434/g.57250 Transcript_21434/m.57250 type:complete len:114 (+) Transcript_21434:1765-2106(+)